MSATADDAKCPNCGKPIGHDTTGCILEVLISIVRDRGNLDEDEILNLWRKCDVDYLWDILGDVIGDLEDGRYSCE